MMLERGIEGVRKPRSTVRSRTWRCSAGHGDAVGGNKVRLLFASAWNGRRWSTRKRGSNQREIKAELRGARPTITGGLKRSEQVARRVATPPTLQIAAHVFASDGLLTAPIKVSTSPVPGQKGYAIPTRCPVASIASPLCLSPRWEQKRFRESHTSSPLHDPCTSHPCATTKSIVFHYRALPSCNDIDGTAYPNTTEASVEYEEVSYTVQTETGPQSIVRSTPAWVSPLTSWLAVISFPPCLLSLPSGSGNRGPR